MSTDERITNVFVLMLENRSFDHMLGFAALSGPDEDGNQVAMRGLTGEEFNSYKGKDYLVSDRAKNTMQVDPKHEFEDVVIQLCGPHKRYIRECPYPNIGCSGFVYNFMQKAGGENPDSVMRCFAPDKLPVLTRLAREFAVCDNWFSSMPGPTWPNRYFLHAGTSGGLDHSPTREQVAKWSMFGFEFSDGTIFDCLGPKRWKIYTGDHWFSQVTTIKGVNKSDTEPLSRFREDVIRDDYPQGYTFLEPSFGDVLGGTYRGGNSQHPLDGVHSGEALIKYVYSSIVNSPVWERSLLVITYDEHGGFFDHCPPPVAPQPNRRQVNDGAVQHNFTFEQYGVRVPAVVVSPYVPKGTVAQRVYDHTSVLRTIEDLWGLDWLTARDREANSLLPICRLDRPRTDVWRPATSPYQAAVADLEQPSVGGEKAAVMSVAEGFAPPQETPLPKEGNVWGFLHSALQADLQEASSPGERRQILNNFKHIATVQDARVFLQSGGREL